MNSDNPKPNEATLTDIYAAADRLKSVLLAGTASPECQALLDTIDACRAPYEPPSWFAKVQQAKREELSKFVQDRELKIMTGPEWMKEAADKVERLRSRLAELAGQEPKVISSPDLSLIIRDVIRSNPVARGTLLSMKIAIAVSDALQAALDKHPAPPAVPERLLSRAEEQIELLLLDADQYEDMESFDLAADAVRTVGVIRDLMNALKREGGEG